MIVLDTNVVSELMRPVPSTAEVDWVRTHSERDLYTTAITLAEISYGIERLPEGRRKELIRTTAEDVFTAFAEHVLPFDARANAPDLRGLGWQLVVAGAGGRSFHGGEEARCNGSG